MTNIEKGFNEYLITVLEIVAKTAIENPLVLDGVNKIFDKATGGKIHMVKAGE